MHAAASYQWFRIYKRGQGHNIDEGKGKQKGKGKTHNYYLSACWYLWRKKGPRL